MKKDPFVTPPQKELIDEINDANLHGRMIHNH